MSLESVANIGLGGGVDPRVTKVLAELQGLKFTVATGAGANSAVTVPGIEIEDTVAALINLTTLAQMDVANVSIVDRRAKGTLTLASTVVADDYVTVNGKRYTFKEITENICTNVPPFQVPIVVGPSGIDTDTVATALAKAIMSGDKTLIATASSNVVTITYRVPGVGSNGTPKTGNYVPLATSGAHVTISGGTLAGGTATSGIKSTDSSSGNTVLVIWYDKNQ